MAIDVTCPGCYKRFQVSDKFAGMKGPCPNCSTMIDIPKANVKIHAPDEYVSGGKTIKGRAILKPIDRVVMTIGTKEWGIALLGVIAVFLVTLLVGKFSASIGIWSVYCIGIGIAGGVGYASSLFGYILLRSGDELEYHEGVDLYKRAGLCAACYTLLWVIFEAIVVYMGLQGGILIWVYLIPFVGLGIIASLAIFDLDIGVAVAHYIIFFLIILILRWAIGFGVLWNTVSISPDTSGKQLPPPRPSIVMPIQITQKK